MDNTPITNPYRESATVKHTCDLPEVPYDAQQARWLDSVEVRRRWPRLEHWCEECGTLTICYASKEHYVMGDW